MLYGIKPRYRARYSSGIYFRCRLLFGRIFFCHSSLLIRPSVCPSVDGPQLEMMSLLFLPLTFGDWQCSWLATVALHYIFRDIVAACSPILVRQGKPKKTCNTFSSSSSSFFAPSKKMLHLQCPLRNAIPSGSKSVWDSLIKLFGIYTISSLHIVFIYRVSFWHFVFWRP